MAIRKPFAVRPLLIGPVRTGNARANRPARNLGLLDMMGMTWRTNGPGNVWVAGAFDAASPVDFVALVAANAQPGTTIRVRLGTGAAEVDGNSAAYDSGVMPFISPALTVESSLYHSHLEIGAPRTVTHWRIDIGGHSGDFEAAGLVIGRKIEPGRFYDRDFERGIEDLGEINISRNGIVTEVPGIVLRTLLFRLGWIGRDEYETKWRPLVEALATRGISYWCFDPEPTAYRQGKTYLGYFGTSPFARAGPIDDVYTKEFRIRSLI